MYSSQSMNDRNMYTFVGNFMHIHTFSISTARRPISLAVDIGGIGQSDLIHCLGIYPGECHVIDFAGHLN